jgi:TRAP transporter 4TM/12TM fusion protein
MKKTGYRPYYAGAVEAVASSGAALMPPVMGSVAFIMAEFLDIPYADVCKAALWPAILYYIATLVQVHYHACKQGLTGLPREELPSIGRAMKRGWHFFIPFLVLIYFLLIARYPSTTSAFYAIFALLLASQFRKESRIGPKRMFQSLEQTGMRMINIVPVCAAAGIIIGSVSLTGLGIHLSSILITISGENVVVLSIIAGAASVIMSMGMPWTACYILLAILIAPSLVFVGDLGGPAHSSAPVHSLHGSHIFYYPPNMPGGLCRLHDFQVFYLVHWISGYAPRCRGLFGPIHIYLQPQSNTHGFTLKNIRSHVH